MKNRLMLKPGVIAVALTLAPSQAVLAQEAARETIQTVYVTGSNLKRTDKEGTSPVQVITSQDIQASGASTVAELMKQVPAMGSDQNLDTNDGGFSRGVATASLRGLSSTSTLILLNGRRMTPSAYADPNTGNSTLYDLNSIPLSALDRIEILKDGASAVYGSDAIGGVINFITKHNYQGAELSVRAGANDDQRFGRRGVNGFVGKGDLDKDGYNVFLTADLSTRDRVKREDATDIAFDRYRLLNNRYATPYGSSVSSHPAFYRETVPGSRNFLVTQASRDKNWVIRTDCDPAQQLTGSTAMGLSPASILIDRKFCNFDANEYLEAQGAGKDASVLSRAVLKLGQDGRAFLEAAYARTERQYSLAPITLAQNSVNTFTSSGVGTPFQAILEIGHPDNPFPNARASVAYRFENLHAGTEVKNDNYRLLAGLQGSAAGWDWESAILWNGSKKRDITYGRLYLPTLRTLNTGTALAQLAADPTLGHDVVTDNMASITQWDFKANREFGRLPGGPMQLAFGAEIRQEKIKLDPDPLVAAGQIFGLANTIIDGSRNVKSAFVELRTPLLKRLEMDFAGRFDKYPDIKTNFVPKVGAKWSVSDSFALRGTYAKGFRAPALVQVTPGGAQFFLSNLYDPKRCESDEVTPKPGASELDCRKSAAGTGGANPELVPEKSNSHSLGLIFSPSASLDVLVEYFRIRKEGEVALGTAFDALKREDQNPGNVVRDPNPANWVTDPSGKPIPNTGPLLMIKEPWTNQGATEVRGFDLELRWRKRLGQYGTFNSKLSSTYTKSYTVAQKPGDIETNIAGANAGIYDWNLSSGIDVPKWKSNLTTFWSYGVHLLSASINYIGPVSLLRVTNGDITYPEPFCHFGTPKKSDAEPNRNSNAPLYEQYYPSCDIHSWTTLGLRYEYSGIRNLTLSLAVQNVLDTKAPYDPSYGTLAGAPLAGYNAGLHDNTGRYFILSARYAF